MKEKTFEKELPEGYEKIYYLNAKNMKVGIIFNLVALGVLAAVILIAAIPLWIDGDVSFEIGYVSMIITYAAFIATMIIYIILHELVHGAAYKALTGEKLTFGMSWSCAFCGVPHIYTYRKTALISVAAPLTVFTLVLVPLTVIMYFIHPLFYILSAIIFGLHLGGCSGDIYVIYLLTCKFKKKKLLMRDTGPEQFFYIQTKTEL